jgi:hypothetical protein
MSMRKRTGKRLVEHALLRCGMFRNCFERKQRAVSNKPPRGGRDSPDFRLHSHGLILQFPPQEQDRERCVHKIFRIAFIPLTVNEMAAVFPGRV